MKSLARDYVSWPKMEQDIEAHVRECGACQAMHPSIHHEAYVPWTWPSRRWQRVFMDFDTAEGQKLFVLQDGHSKWPEVHIMPKTDAASVITVIRSLFATWGVAEEMVSDNGPPFQSEELKMCFEKNGVVHRFSPTYHPQSNGQIEVGVKTLTYSLEKQLMGQKTSARTLQHRVDVWCFAYRNTPHTVSEEKPSEMFLGRQPRTPFSMLHPRSILEDKMNELREKKKAEQRATITEYQPGDLVWSGLAASIEAASSG